MHRISSLLAAAALPLCSTAQTVLNNSGGIINISSAGQVYVSGNMSNSASASLNNDGLLTITGTFSNDAPMGSPASGTLNFNGSGAQTLDGASEYFAKDVVVNNPAGITLNTRLKVDGVMSFNNGVIDATNASYPVVFTANASLSGINPPTDASHIKGYVVKEGTGLFTYPIGDGSKYQPVGVNLSGNSAGLSARYYAADAGSTSFGTNGASSTPLLYYNTNEYWDLTPAGTASGSVTIYWDGYNNRGIGATSDLRVAHKSGGVWLNEDANSLTGDISAGSLTSGAVSTWSPFTLGSVSGGSPLPVQLLTFNATAIGDANRISWQTGAEKDITAFEVERSADGKSYTAIGRQTPTGSGSAYSFNDVQPLKGTAYYRLHILESTRSSYSQTLSLTRSGSSGLTLSVYPNPAMEELHVQTSEPGIMMLKDVSGRAVIQAAVEGQECISLKSLTPGLYFATFQTKGYTESIRISKQ